MAQSWPLKNMIQKSREAWVVLQREPIDVHWAVPLYPCPVQSPLLCLCPLHNFLLGCIYSQVPLPGNGGFYCHYCCFYCCYSCWQQCTAHHMLDILDAHIDLHKSMQKGIPILKVQTPKLKVIIDVTMCTCVFKCVRVCLQASLLILP